MTPEQGDPADGQHIEASSEGDGRERMSEREQAVETLAFREFCRSPWVVTGYDYGDGNRALWNQAAEDLRERYRRYAREDLDALASQPEMVERAALAIARALDYDPNPLLPQLWAAVHRRHVKLARAALEAALGAPSQPEHDWWKTGALDTGAAPARFRWRCDRCHAEQWSAGVPEADPELPCVSAPPQFLWPLRPDQ